MNVELACFESAQRPKLVCESFKRLSYICDLFGLVLSYVFDIFTSLCSLGIFTVIDQFRHNVAKVGRVNQSTANFDNVTTKFINNSLES